jgi:STE24 endopeptidase
MNIYLIFVLVILIGFTLFDAWIHWLNLKAIAPEIPAEFEGVYDRESYAKSQRYLKDSTRFDILSGLIKTAVSVAFILFGGFALAHRLALGAADTLIVQGLVFAGFLLLLSTLFGLPFSLYNTFVLEEKYGFNKTTPKTFAADLLKSLLLTALIGGPIFAGILWFFQSAGGNAWWISWMVLTLIQLLLMYIAPVYILPLFNKFEPLEQGELRTAIESYAEKEGFEVQGLFKIDGSKRSTRANAYFTGFGKTRRIALFDTLIANHSTPELVAVLAHEVGHAKCRHIHKQLAAGILSIGLMFYLLSLFIGRPGMYEAFGLEVSPDSLPLYAGLIFFGFLYSPIASLIGIFTNILSRKFEFEADAFAARTTGGSGELIAALKRLSVDNLSNLTPHPWLVFLEYSHPPVLRRIEALRAVPLPSAPVS